MKLYLDDVRSSPLENTSWVTVQTYEDAVLILSACWDSITEVSLDHDLGTYKSGYDVLNFIEETAHNKGYMPFTIYIHTMNMSVYKKMERVALDLRERYK